MARLEGERRLPWAVRKHPPGSAARAMAQNEIDMAAYAGELLNIPVQHWPDREKLWLGRSLLQKAAQYINAEGVKHGA